MDGERLPELSLSEDLHWYAATGRETGRPEGVGCYLGAFVEALVEVTQVDGLRVGAELLERHGLLHVRTAKLSHPHVDRVLPSLESDPTLGPGTGARALLAASRCLAHARALAAADALAPVRRALGGLEVVKADQLLALVRHP
jgi:hypothetical protein